MRFMIQPFTKKQIYRYLLAYVGVVVFMGLFYFVVTYYYEPETHPTKVFSKQAATTPSKVTESLEETPQATQNTIRLLPKNP